MGHGIFLRPQIEAGTDPPIGTSEDTNFDKSQVRAGLKKKLFLLVPLCTAGWIIHFSAKLSWAAVPQEFGFGWGGEERGNFKSCSRQCHCEVNVAESGAENTTGLCHCTRLLSFFLLAYSAWVLCVLAYSSLKKHLNTLPVQILTSKMHSCKWGICFHP